VAAPGSTQIGRIALGVALAVAAASLTILAHPPGSLGPLLLVSYVPMIVAQHHVLPRRFAGVATAIGIAGPTWYGISLVLPDRSAPALRVFPFVLAALLLVIGWLDRALMERTRYRTFVFLVPLVWTAISLPLAYGPTGTIGIGVNAFASSPSLIQPISIVGTLGLVLVVYLANWSVASIVLSALRHPDFPPKRMIRIAGGVVIVALVWVGTSLLLLDRPQDTLRVAAIQPGPRAAAFSNRSVDALGSYEDATRTAVRRGADLVVWPEAGLSFDPKRTSAERLRRLARSTGAHLVVGYVVWAQFARNEAILVDPSGEIHGPYAKQHPVTILGERSDSDHGYPVFDTSLGKIGLAICYDLDYFDTARTLARGGAGLLAVPSADWSEIADVHHNGFVFRAIENRLSIVKADTAWDSAIIDPFGRVREQTVTPEGTEAILVASVPLGSGRTPAGAIGDLNGVVIAMAALVVLALAIRRARRREPPAFP
jgi:apolipoprotein N-acyltransferase